MARSGLSEPSGTVPPPPPPPPSPPPPPDVRAVTPVRGVAADAISRVTRVDISGDGEPAMLAAPSDGVFDQLSEGFELELPESVVKGNHTLLLQVTDEAGNTGALRLAIAP